ncbi:hypothetical protein [Pedosphaera parvula]|nr:hypothetical protein [Pedosphaera parvula]
MPKEISEWQEGFWFEARRRPQALSFDSDKGDNAASNQKHPAAND